MYTFSYCFYIPSVDGHLDCFHILAIVDSAAVNIGVHISFRISVFIFFTYPEVELLESMVVLFLIFWGIPILFSIVVVPM